jgi:hypothetical protein
LCSSICDGKIRLADFYKLLVSDSLWCYRWYRKIWERRENAMRTISIVFSYHCLLVLIAINESDVSTDYLLCNQRIHEVYPRWNSTQNKSHSRTTEWQSCRSSKKLRTWTYFIISCVSMSLLDRIGCLHCIDNMTCILLLSEHFWINDERTVRQKMTWFAAFTTNIKFMIALNERIALPIVWYWTNLVIESLKVYLNYFQVP